MFSWIEKVIPQPPETPRKSVSDDQDCPASPVPVTEKCAEKVTCVGNETNNAPADSNVQDGNALSDKSSGSVLSWLAQGLGKVVPHPVDSPSLSRTNKEETIVEEKPKPVIAAVEKKMENGPTDQTEGSSLGVLSWLSHGLEKVVPQPTWAQKSSGSSEQSAAPAEQKLAVEEKTEKSEEMNIPPVSPVHSPAPPPVVTPAPAPVEVPPAPAPALEAKEAVPDKGAGSGVLNWLMQGLGKVVPQPETPVVAAKKVEEEKSKEEEPPAPPPATRKDSKVNSETAGVLSWITQGLEKVIPQPVSKQDSQNAMLCHVEEKGSGV